MFQKVILKETKVAQNVMPVTKRHKKTAKVTFLRFFKIFA